MLRFFRVPIIILNGLCKCFAVPLSATQAPVTGLTDILTPVNLLPNSDFTRGWSRTSSRTFNFDSLSYSSDTPLIDQWSIHLQNCTMTNVTVIVGPAQITMQGTVTYTNVTGDYAQIILKSNGTYIVGKTYTVATFGGTCNADDYNFATYLSGSTIYNNPVASPTSSNPAITIRTMTANTLYGSVCNLNSVNAQNTTFNVDITFRDAVVYEGEFKNPPYINSLDTKPEIQFLHTNYDNTLIKAIKRCTSLFRNTDGTFDKDYWYDLCEIKTANSMSGSSNCSYLLFKISGLNLYPDASAISSVFFNFTAAYRENTYKTSSLTGAHYGVNCDFLGTPVIQKYIDYAVQGSLNYGSDTVHTSDFRFYKVDDHTIRLQFTTDKDAAYAQYFYYNIEIFGSNSWYDTYRNITITPLTGQISVPHYPKS